MTTTSKQQPLCTTGVVVGFIARLLAAGIIRRSTWSWGWGWGWMDLEERLHRRPLVNNRIWPTIVDNGVV
jgi:hypothetical protein